MEISLIIGLVLTIGLILGLSIFSGTRSKKPGLKNGTAITAGIIMGTLVGGSSTVGTAQLAYNYGMSAWWFTLGGGIACLVLAIGFVGPFRKSGCSTLVQMIEHEYGPSAGMAASILNSVGTFINIISQLIAATAVITVLFPQLGLIPELLISAVFMILYVVFGGAKGAGMVGILKLALLYVAMMASGIMVLFLTGGVGGALELFRGIDSQGVNLFSLVARGAGKDIGACVSLIFGVLTTQTYAQAILASKTDATARKGAVISACMIPPIGIGGILVGLYMRATHPGIVAKTALTSFVMEQMPPLLSGIIMGALFIAVVGTGAGLALGISFIVNKDIIKRFTHKLDNPRIEAIVGKTITAIVLLLGVCLSTGSLGDTILQFAFMSMGLRGAVVLVPMCCSIWLKGRIKHVFAMISIIVSPILVLIFGVVNVLPFDSLFVGIAASVVIMAIGLAVGNKDSRLQTTNG
ncbi:MAG: sodium:solute symporter family protein [Oscillospiraceae bacterium]|nr:sodium:solute symporter family protein [Oscillospiraceae bacterium]